MLHKEVRDALISLFPHQTIWEEVYLPIGGVYFDFLLPHQRLVVEANGIQHYQKTMFHENKFEFLRAQQRDRDKRRFCELNGITFCEVRYDDRDIIGTIRKAFLDGGDVSEV